MTYTVTLEVGGVVVAEDDHESRSDAVNQAVDFAVIGIEHYNPKCRVIVEADGHEVCNLTVLSILRRGITTTMRSNGE